jgi:hypothetical protein
MKRSAYQASEQKNRKSKKNLKIVAEKIQKNLKSGQKHQKNVKSF